MMRTTVKRAFGRMLLGTCLSALFYGRQAAGQQRGSIPVRELTTPVATDSGSVRSIVTIRPLSDGRVLVCDVGLHRVALFDQRQKLVGVVLDNEGTSGAKRFGTSFGMLMPYIGDSSLFVDLAASAMLVLDPKGSVMRTIAPPDARDVKSIVSWFYGPNGSAGTDPRGRLIYRVAPPVRFQPQKPGAERDSGSIRFTNTVDTAFIVRGDMELRRIDTIGKLKIPVRREFNIAIGGGSYAGQSVVNPISAADEWTLLPDGTVAIVRSRDYHIDWVSATGAVTSSPKLPFDWRRITLEEKEHLIDSAKKVEEATLAKLPPVPGRPPGVRVPILAVSPDELPDYYPPVRPGQVRADPEGNVWILPSTSTLSGPNAKGLIFDVVNRRGEIFERVRLPEGRGLVGLGAGGVVYMYFEPHRGDMRLERARIIH